MFNLLQLSHLGDVCSVPMDMTLIVDSSGNIGRQSWVHLLDFIQALVNLFDVSQSGTHVGLISYSSDAKVALKLNTLSGSLLSRAELTRQVGRLRWEGGLRRIDLALELANKEILNHAAGMRNVPRVREFFRNRLRIKLLSHTTQIAVLAIILTLMMTSAEVVETSPTPRTVLLWTTLTRTLKPHRRLRLLGSNHLPLLLLFIINVILINSWRISFVNIHGLATCNILAVPSVFCI